MPLKYRDFFNIFKI